MISYRALATYAHLTQLDDVSLFDNLPQ